jgi:hypothetical protein
MPPIKNFLIMEAWDEHCAETKSKERKKGDTEGWMPDYCPRA